jgi:hypothetical protein
VTERLGLLEGKALTMLTGASRDMVKISMMMTRSRTKSVLMMRETALTKVRDNDKGNA